MGMPFRASHGVLAHEQTTPQTFIVDMEANVDLLQASRSDDLAHTIDYGALADLIAHTVQAKPVQLIEHLAGRIADAIMAEYPPITALAITVHKPHAPINQICADISVTVNRRRESSRT